MPVDLLAKQPRDLLADVPATPTVAPIGRLARMARGAEDVIDAPAQWLVNALPEKFVSALNKNLGDKIAPTASQFNAQQAQEEREYQAGRAAAGSDGFDGYRVLGNVAASAPLMPLLPGGGATLAGAAGRGAVSGAVMGGMQPVTDDQASFGEQKAKQVGIGAATGAVFAPLMKLIGNAISPKVDADVSFLRERGVTPTVGQMLGKGTAKAEEKATSIPVLGDYIAGAQRRSIDDFNRAAYNEALAPVGIKYTGKVGHEGIDAVQRTLSGSYEDLLKGMTFQLDDKFVQDLSTADELAKLLPPDKLKQFTGILEKELKPRISEDGVMAGDTVKKLESELGRYIKKFGASPSVDDQMVADSLGQVQRAVRSTLERSNPKQAERLASINKGWAIYARLRDAASRAGATKNDGVFTPEALYAAVRSGDKSVGKGATAGGKALMQDFAKAGVNVLGSKYPDSGTAGRLLGPGLLGMSFLSPGAALTAAAGVAPYTSVGQKLAASLLADRPNIAPQIAAGFGKTALPAQAAVLASIMEKPTPQLAKGK